MSPVIEVVKATKRFRKPLRRPGIKGAIIDLFHPRFSSFLAVDNVSFQISEGEAVGYLGPNGAGKSTMLKLLTGVQIPDDGTIAVLGRTPHVMRRQNAKEIGVVFGQRTQLWWDLPVRDSFQVQRAIYDIPVTQFDRRFGELTELLSMSHFLDQPARQLSLGQRMRADLALSLLHSPRILFLDEPTIGIDVVGKAAIRSALKHLSETRSTTIILTTHDLQDIEQVCRRVIIVDRSRLVYDGPIDQLRYRLPTQRRLILYFREDPGELTIEAARPISNFGTEKHYLLEDSSTGILDILTSIGPHSTLRDVSIKEPSIEDLLASFYQDRERANV